MNAVDDAASPRSSEKRVHTLHVLDAGWLLLESPSNLMHGGILCVFDIPKDAAEHFVVRLGERMRQRTAPATPFNRRLKRTGLSRLLPQWETVERVDIDAHLHSHTLPAPGGSAELNALVSRLQSLALDHGRPLWEIHLIDGLADSRFAIYGKMHHALADGVTALTMVNTWLSDDPTDATEVAMWAVPPRKRDVASSSAQPAGRPRPKQPANPLQMIRGTVRAVAAAATGVSARPWSAPKTVLNTPISSRRTVVTQSFDLRRFQQLAKRAGGTVNDTVLMVCAGALRRYLSDDEESPKKSLITNIPVALRGESGGHRTSNAITWAMLPLSTDIDDVRDRFDAVRTAANQAKSQLAAIDPSAINTYTLLAVLPILVEQLTRLGGRLPPLYNVPISNVPGPSRTKFLDGAPLREIHAQTVLYGGQALNVVAVSYAGQLNFSFTACADQLPDVHHLARHSRDALAEVEDAYGLLPPRSEDVNGQDSAHHERTPRP